MKTKIMVLLLLLTLMCGCQLAKEDLSSENMQRDRLIGVFITLEHLDLFDDERYLEDNLNSILLGKNPDTIEMRAYSERLYAVLADRILTNEESGNTITTQEYVFDTVEGFSYFVPLMEENGEVYIATNSDPAISHGHTAVNSGDKEEYTLTGTLYLTPSCGESVCYLNPVYQSADGSVYAVQGSGYDVSGSKAEGPNITCTLSEESTVTINGETKASRTSVSISVEVMFAPEEITVAAFSEEDQLIERTAFRPCEMPKRFAPHPETAYVIVRTCKHDPQGNEITTAQLYDKTKEGFETYFCREDGVCVGNYTKLEW